MTDVLCDIERSGLKINLDTLEEIEDQYRQELLILEGELRDLAQEAMGDTPVNLNSPDDKSKLILLTGRALDKGTWKSIFNLGTEIRGATAKPKMRPRMTPKEFAANVSRNTKVDSTRHGRNSVVTVQAREGSPRLARMAVPAKQCVSVPTVTVLASSIITLMKWQASR